MYVAPYTISAAQTVLTALDALPVKMPETFAGEIAMMPPFCVATSARATIIPVSVDAERISRARITARTHTIHVRRTAKETGMVVIVIAKVIIRAAGPASQAAGINSARKSVRR
jgi:hypothetical protein